MPLVPVPKKTLFSSLSPRVRIAAFILLFAVLTLSGFAGWQLYLTLQKAREQQAYDTAMSQADYFVKRSEPGKAAAVLEKFLSTKNVPLDHRYHATSTLAYSYVQDHQDQKAYDTLKRTDALGVQPPSIYVLRSLAYYSLMHHDKAAALGYYRRAVAVAEAKYDPEATPYVAGWKKQIQELEATN